MCPCVQCIFVFSPLLSNFFVLLIFNNFIMMYLDMVSFETIISIILDGVTKLLISLMWIYIFHEIWVVFCCFFFLIFPFLTSSPSSGTLITHTSAHSLCPPRVSQAPFHYPPHSYTQQKYKYKIYLLCVLHFALLLLLCSQIHWSFFQQHLTS